MAWEIGRRLFTDGLERIVYADAGTQFVYDDEGNRIVGEWLVNDEPDADVPRIVAV